jgi:hypothetical protein
MGRKSVGVMDKSVIDELAESMPIPLKNAYELIPFPTLTALYQFLGAHPEITPIYRKVRWYEVRCLTVAQIKQIRELTFHGREASRYRFTTGRPVGSGSGNRGGRGFNRYQPSGPIGAIMRRATTMATILMVAIGLTGCTSTSEMIKAMGENNSSGCVILDASLYGAAVICRSNSGGMATIEASRDSVRIIHNGSAVK